MLKRAYQIPRSIVGIIEFIVSFLCWDLAYYLRFHAINWPLAEHVPSHMVYVKAGAFIALVTSVTFLLTGAYKAAHWRWSSEFQQIVKSCFWVLVVALAIAFFYRKFSYSRVHVAYFMGLLLINITLVRYIARKVIGALAKKGVSLRKGIVVGGAEVTEQFIKTLNHYPHSGLSIQGVVAVDDDQTAGEFPCLGKVADLHDIIAEYGIQQVFIALSAEQQNHLDHIRSELLDQLVDIKIIPDLGRFERLLTDVETFEGIPIITVTQSPMIGWNVVLKRVMDFLGSLVCLVLFAPIMLLISVFVKLSSPGPIFYRQERMGLDGVTFQTLKFRTMPVDAEQKTGAVWAQSGDNRSTGIGSVLRKTSLDELPQLFNVVAGQMSLVGPRPERPVFIENFKKEIPGYMLRHKVKAGMTGWAQVNGWRGNTSLEKRIECDLYYIEHWSIWLDIKILFLTIFKGFVHKNAY